MSTYTLCPIKVLDDPLNFGTAAAARKKAVSRIFEVVAENDPSTNIPVLQGGKRYVPFYLPRSMHQRAQRDIQTRIQMYIAAEKEKFGHLK
ncbi:hypothetical protein TNCV_4901661 [Trichonephila clavipes]|nr:hypothetical protein TNCV_4901661 [Trichonephila clavipes]